MQATLGEVVPAVLFVTENRKTVVPVVWFIDFEATCHNSKLHSTSPSQTKQPNKKKSLTFVFCLLLTWLFILHFAEEVSLNPPP